MTGLTHILERLREVSLLGDAEDHLKRVTMYHRIQGSSGLIKAVEEVAEVFSSMGYEVKVFDIPSSDTRGFMSTPTSWDIHHGKLEVKIESETKVVYDQREHPTLIAAHSPPGEGCGEVTICSDISSCKGDVVLVEAPGYIAYKEIPAKLIMLYDSKRYPEAVPYMGLFIDINEVEEKSVVNIPYTLASRIISRVMKGGKVEVCWSIKTEFSTRPLKGLIAYKGSDPGVLYISHICHPKPGAHDNASGVVANILTAKMLDEKYPGLPRAHLFIPEYSGTIYVHRYTPWTPKAVVNLDMVGSKQWITNSTLNIVIPPVFLESRVSAYLYLASKAVFDESASFGGFKLPSIRYSISPYTAGSDHDVTLVWGLDSGMLNEWPSKYYHTDMDNIDSISPRQLVNTAIVSALTGILLHEEYRSEEVLENFRSYLKSWYALEGLRHGVDLSPLSKLLEKRTRLEYNPEYTPVSSRYIYKKLGFEVYEKLRKIKGAYTFTSTYWLIAERAGIKDPLEVFQLENILSWSSEEKEVIQNIWLHLREEINLGE